MQALVSAIGHEPGGHHPVAGPTTPLSPPQHFVTRNTSQGVGCIHGSRHGRRIDSNDLDRFRMRRIGLRRSPYLGENSDAAVEPDTGQMAGFPTRSQVVGDGRIVSWMRGISGLALPDVVIPSGSVGQGPRLPSEASAADHSPGAR